jgi:hypothetical protein
MQRKLMPKVIWLTTHATALNIVWSMVEWIFGFQA